MRNLALILVTTIAVALVGCTPIEDYYDNSNVRTKTTFRPIMSNETECSYFEFSVRTDIGNLADDPNAEKLRIKKLEKKLTENGYDVEHYEITARTPVFQNNTIWGIPLYRIYYTVRVKDDRNNINSEPVRPES